VIGAVIVSHGSLAAALLETASEIVGPLEACEALAVSRHDRLEDVEAAIAAALERVDRGRGALILADMFGGTASNVALQLVGRRPLEVVTGCNLPMLLKFSGARVGDVELGALARLLRAYGQKSVLVASELFEERGPHG
jgi:PTS system mannose-specific IIA component